MTRYVYPSEVVYCHTFEDGTDEWAWIHTKIGPQHTKDMQYTTYGSPTGTLTWEYETASATHFRIFFENPSDAMWYRLVWN